MSKIRLWWFSFWLRVWYGITQFFTGFTQARLIPVLHPNEIIERLGFGNRYRPDRRAGAMTHPRRVQARLNAGERAGDCEDHAGYWIAQLLHWKHASEAYMGTIYYTASGVEEAHAIVVFRVNGDYFWADYDYPAFLKDRDDWVEAVLAVYGDTLRGAFLWRASLSAEDKVRFHEPVYYLREWLKRTT